MTGFERPTPDLEKIVAAWHAWGTGNDDVLPGRTMADLKIAGVDHILATLAEDNDLVVPIAQTWREWERGRVGPRETLTALQSGGFADIVEALAEPA